MVTRRSQRNKDKHANSGGSKGVVLNLEEFHDVRQDEELPSPSKNDKKATLGRKRSRVENDSDSDSDSDNDDRSDELDCKQVGNAKRSAITRSSTATKKRNAPASTDDKDDEPHGGRIKQEEDSDFEPEQDAAKSRRGRKKKKNASKSKKAGSLEGRTCPHCSKVISTKMGLKYHLDNFVCRIDQCDDPVLIAKAKRKRGKCRGGTTLGPDSKRFRGDIANRTCPLCNRIFTSELGCSYHVQHKVCQTKTVAKKENAGLVALEPGSKFVTQFGVVEVVKDEREIPRGNILPPNIKSLLKLYQGNKARVDGNNARLDDAIASQLRVRRSKIDGLYREGKATKLSMFDAYFGGDPRKNNDEKPVLMKQKEPQDPSATPDFCPDRIVECILIPDERKRFLSTDINNPTECPGDAISGTTPVRLFLQRRILTEPYVIDLSLYACPDCGRSFASLAGVRYHVNGNVCVQRQASEAEKRRLRQESIQRGSEVIASDNNAFLDMVPKSAIRIRSNKRKRRARNKGAKQLGMYPEVLISLGFKVVKEDMEFTDDIKLPPLVARNSENETDDGLDAEDAVLGDPDFHEPGVLLEHLREELKYHKNEYERAAADQKHGAMYAGVYKSLGYKKGKTIMQLPPRASKRRRKSTKPPPPPKPLPPIIDTRALADEIDSGRYPSMKRYTEDNHSEYCAICRDGGDLVCCDFCSNAEHLTCIRTRFTVKNPEPEDDFLCHKCLMRCLMRRNRAEKRRLEKLQRDEQRLQEKQLEERRLNPGIQKGMEYPYMAARGQDVSELVEILQDAQTRLKQALATSKMNNIRRKAMGCYYASKFNAFGES